MNTDERITDYTVSAADAAALNYAVSAGDVYPVLVVNRTEPDGEAPGFTYGHLFYHGGSFPISFPTPDKPAASVQGPEPAAGVNTRTADEPTFEQPADTGHELTTVRADTALPAINGPGTPNGSLTASAAPAETEAEMEARLRRELAPPPNTETPAEMETRLRAKLVAEGTGNTGTGSEVRL